MNEMQKGESAPDTKYAVLDTKHTGVPFTPEAAGIPSRSTPSPLRAWCYLVVLSLQRQARVRQMVWMSLALLGVSVFIVGIITLRGGSGIGQRRVPNIRGEPPLPWSSRPTYADLADTLNNMRAALSWSPAMQDVVSGAYAAVLERSGFAVFSRFWISFIFVTFLLPMWSISFATESFGNDREGSSMLWLLTRPLSRPAIYLAKFTALLPWSLALNMGGFALICWTAGRPGSEALRLFWPAVLCGTLAYAALFQLIGAFFRRPAIIGVVYTFFLETILGNMPGYMKRLSLSFYTNCMMYDAAQEHGFQPEKPSIYLPVDGDIAVCVLLVTTVVLVLAGMAIFTRVEYREAAI